MKEITQFSLKKDDLIAKRFKVEEKLGGGWEGEVYRVTELTTNLQRAVKLFYPKRNEKFLVSKRYARKLDKLNDCPLVMNYHSHEIIKHKNTPVACLVSELIEGDSLHKFVERHRAKRLNIFPALHLLHSLVEGVDWIHRTGEYHGDLHTDNVIIRRFGLKFDIKVIDLHHWGDSKKDNREEDIIKMIRIFYDILGGAERYSKLPSPLKYIICGLKRGLILERFKTAGMLKKHLETMEWTDATR